MYKRRYNRWLEQTLQRLPDLLCQKEWVHHSSQLVELPLALDRDEQATLAEIVSGKVASDGLNFILGQPGAGKSTVLHQLALRMAQEGREVPVLVTGGQLHSHLHESHALATWLAHSTRCDLRMEEEKGLLETLTAITALVGDRPVAQLTLLVDGLDEVADGSRLLQELLDLDRVYSGPQRRLARIIVSSRPWAHEALPATLKGQTTVVRIKPLDPQRSADVARSLLGSGDGHDMTYVTLASERFSGSPLLVYLACSLAKAGVKPPESVTELYDGIVDLLWDRAGRRGTSEAKAPAKELGYLLAYVVHRLGYSAGSKLASRGMVANVLMEALVALSNRITENEYKLRVGTVSAEALLEGATVGGLLTPESTGGESKVCIFVHRTIQEFLAAKFLTHKSRLLNPLREAVMPDGDEVWEQGGGGFKWADKSFITSEWWAEVYFFAGLMQGPSWLADQLIGGHEAALQWLQGIERTGLDVEDLGCRRLCHVIRACSGKERAEGGDHDFRELVKRSAKAMVARFPTLAIKLSECWGQSRRLRALSSWRYVSFPDPVEDGVAPRPLSMLEPFLDLTSVATEVLLDWCKHGAPELREEIKGAIRSACRDLLGLLRDADPDVRERALSLLAPGRDFDELASALQLLSDRAEGALDALANLLPTRGSWYGKAVHPGEMAGFGLCMLVTEGSATEAQLTDAVFKALKVHLNESRCSAVLSAMEMTVIGRRCMVAALPRLLMETADEAVCDALVEWAWQHGVLEVVRGLLHALQGGVQPQETGVMAVRALGRLGYATALRGLAWELQQEVEGSSGASKGGGEEWRETTRAVTETLIRRLLASGDVEEDVRGAAATALGYVGCTEADVGHVLKALDDAQDKDQSSLVRQRVEEAKTLLASVQGVRGPDGECAALRNRLVRALLPGCRMQLLYPGSVHEVAARLLGPELASTQLGVELSLEAQIELSRDGKIAHVWDLKSELNRKHRAYSKEQGRRVLARLVRRFLWDKCSYVDAEQVKVICSSPVGQELLVQELEPRLKDEDRVVRGAAAAALTVALGAAAADVTVLEEALKEAFACPETRERGKVALALAQVMGHSFLDQEGLLQDLLKVAKDPQAAPAARVDCVRVLATAGAGSGEVVQAFLEILRQERSRQGAHNHWARRSKTGGWTSSISTDRIDPDVRDKVAVVMGSICVPGPHLEGAIDDLLELLATNDMSLRTFAVKALGSIGEAVVGMEKEPSVINALVQQLLEGDGRGIRGEAATALGKMGAAAASKEAVWDALIDCMGERDAYSAMALLCLCEHAVDTIPMLTSMDRRIPLKGIIEAGDAIVELVSRSRSPHRFEKMAAIFALGRIAGLETAAMEVIYTIGAYQVEHSIKAVSAMVERYFTKTGSMPTGQEAEAKVTSAVLAELHEPKEAKWDATILSQNEKVFLGMLAYLGPMTMTQGVIEALVEPLLSHQIEDDKAVSVASIVSDSPLSVAVGERLREELRDRLQQPGEDRYWALKTLSRVWLTAPSVLVPFLLEELPGLSDEEKGHLLAGDKLGNVLWTDKKVRDAVLAIVDKAPAIQHSTEHTRVAYGPLGALIAMLESPAEHNVYRENVAEVVVALSRAEQLLRLPLRSPECTQ